MTSRMIAGTDKAMAKAKQSFKIFHTELPPNKNLVLALRHLWGFGIYEGRKVCQRFGLHPNLKLKSTTHPLINKWHELQKYIHHNYVPRFEARKEGADIIDKVRSGSYQGIRHMQCMPVNGQNTRNNAKQQRRLGAARMRRYEIPPFPRQQGGSQKPEVVAEKLRLAAKAAADAAAAATAAKQAAAAGVKAAATKTPDKKKK